MIELAYRVAEAAGIPLWNQDEARPYQTVPSPGESWQPEGNPERQPHEYVRNGTAKLLTRFHPVTGEVRGKGVTSASNAVPHPWLQTELTAILRTLPVLTTPEEERPEAAQWKTWLGHDPRHPLLSFYAAPASPSTSSRNRRDSLRQCAAASNSPWGGVS
jgi:hypothetical protein